MVDSTDKTEEAKSRRKAALAGVVEGLRSLLDSDEQLLSFSRGRLAGGIKGKLTIGPEQRSAGH